MVPVVVSAGHTESNHQEKKETMPDGCCCFRCVRTQEVGIVEDLGEFKRILSPGFHFVLFPFSDLVGSLSLRIQQLDVVCETKTKDNVFIQVNVAVQYFVIQESAYDAYYSLTDPRGQIQSYVFDVVRSTVPKLELDEAFASKQEIAVAVRTQLESVMRGYGYAIKVSAWVVCDFANPECLTSLFLTIASPYRTHW